MASMNRGLNLPSIQKIMNEFEKESSMMDMKEEMMSDAVDDVMDAEEDEEEEGDKILKEVLDEIGVDLSQKACCLHYFALCMLTELVFQLTDAPIGIATTSSPLTNKQPVALGESAPMSSSRPDISSAETSSGGGGTDEDALQARLDALRRG
jgi:charged multivesicular body protein 2A